MKIKLIYPRWPKLARQTEFHLPPHGPVVFAAALPDYVSVDFVDENLDAIDFDDPVDAVCISMMLTVQVKRGWQIADWYRAKGVPVIFGGIATMLHAEETQMHADAVFLGEAEGRMETVFGDLAGGRLKKVYDYLGEQPSLEHVGPARRDILKRDLYNYKGVQMVDLVHASRGCRYHCYPCAVAYLGGRKFRPRPVARSVEEMAAIDNNRLFIVDNSLAQDTRWEMELFREMIPLKKKWCCHPIEDDPKVLDLAAQAGAWYVYQAVFDTSDYIKERIRRYHDHGIGVEGTILLGLDRHTEDEIKRLVEFLLEIDLDLAEFTVLTPFPHTKAYDDLKRQGRIFSYDWDTYSADQVVYQPRHMAPERLQELLHWAWDTFYQDESQEIKMSKLFQKVVRKEMADNTYRPRRREMRGRAFGRTGTAAAAEPLKSA
ncbi:B12-binding domain-containing radical SAM protein [Desulfosarcina ovata]|uniref:B12-binding domain-containing radical SAM protein n=1 Tax=Desulfosarcina ovata subsp. ovata TaxID=2752305 RepID=A0A5K8A889_9BACT|nr:radical SAM protein [Desulfosarcina ovata]BBO88842.1 B12-binding domain-containing radical SAM protein [Desulfosarcina ovata subsp. ovata]